jgi:hypothetical protein
LRRGLAALLGALLPAASLAADPAPAAEAASPPHADVVRVAASGRSGAYQLAVTVKSPDRGCDHYASWWEVVSPEGKLLFRRVLMHSHPDEQPFTRPGGPVPIAADATIVVRAHFHPTGYGGAAVRGSVAKGFAPWTPPPGFAAELAKEPPHPSECWR